MNLFLQHFTCKNLNRYVNYKYTFFKTFKYCKDSNGDKYISRVPRLSQKLSKILENVKNDFDVCSVLHK